MPALSKNTLTPQVDLPTWEWCRFAPAVSAAVSSSCSADNSEFAYAEHGRYIYYLISATQFVRYDTWTDMYQQLATPAVAPAAISSMKFLQGIAPEGNVIAAGASTVTVAAVTQQSLRGYDIVIVSGTGAGQRRTITAVAEPVTVDVGVATAVSNTQGTLTVTDSTKAWNVNQYAGYSMRVTGNAGAGQMRRILSNSATVLTLGDTSQTNKTYNNPGIFTPAIGAVAGSQSYYAIESQVLTVNAAWTVQPDSTSVYRIQSGMIVMASTSAVTAPFYTLQAYDIATDTWYILPAYTGMLSVGTYTDLSIDRTGEISSVWAAGAASSASTTTTLVDASRGVDRAAWTVNQWAGYWVHITSGTGEGQIRQIASNTSNTLTWASAGTAPTATSRYQITGFDAGTATAGAASTITDSGKSWAVNRWANYQVRILAGTGIGQVRAIASNTATALTVVTPWATNPDTTSVYVITGDGNKIFFHFGTLAAVMIHNLDSAVPTFGREQDWGTARIASATVGGHLPVAITTLANTTTTATVTTAHPHQFRVGDLVTVRGATDANFNVTAVAIATVPSATTFTYTMAGSPASTTIALALSTSTMVDVTKNWATNQWAGATVFMNAAGVTGNSGGVTGQSLRILSNTSNTLTLVSGTAPVNGQSRYSIAASSAIGAMDQGVATGTQSTTTLQDTSKVGSFTVNNTNGSTSINVTGVTSGQLYVGHAVSGTGIPTGAVIAAFGTGTGGVGTYTLSMPCTSTNTGLTMSSGWVVNAYAGKRVRCFGGAGPVEVAITSNTSNTLTFAVTTAPVAGQTGYVILEQGAKAVGVNSNWASGTSDANFRGRYMFVTRGGGVAGFDRVDLTTDRVNVMMTTPATETLTTGTMTAYDGVDRIFFHKDATQRIYSLDVVTGRISGASMYPYVAPTAIIGNRMEIFTTRDGLKYLWLNRASFAECFRCLLFW